MKPNGKKKLPPGRRDSEKQAALQAVGSGQVPNKAVGLTGETGAPARTSFGRRDGLFAAALVFAVCLAYWPASNGGFIFDDDVSLDNAVRIPGTLAKIWVPGVCIRYWPVTFTTHGLQYDLWELNPFGFHLTNLALHVLAALLAWRVFVQLQVRGALLGAAIFALHPVNVESVAWISQLKSILALVLALISTLFYLQDDERGAGKPSPQPSPRRRGGHWRYALALGAFGLSALAKGMVLTLPIVWLALAWWQRGRIDRRDLLRVVPFVLITLIMVFIEVWAGRLDGSEIARSDSFLSRAAIAGRAVWFYFGKLLWPLDLSFVYPRWRLDEPNVLAFLPGALLVLLFAVAWRQRRSWGRAVLVLLVGYVALLLPALGFVNVGFMLYSLVGDHYQYAAMLVPGAVFAGAATTLWSRLHWPPRAGYAIAAGLLAMLSCLTWQQSQLYADAETLYRATIEHSPDCWLAHYNLGVLLAKRGRFDEAIPQYRKTLETKPFLSDAHYNLGVALEGVQQLDEAISQYETAIQIKPRHADAHNNLGLALARRGQFDEAIAHFQRALEIKPDHADARWNLDLVRAKREELRSAP